MSKKDYEVIAAIARSHYEYAAGVKPESAKAPMLKWMDSMVDSMADAFKRDNVRFQKDLFLDAATPGWHRADRGMTKMKRSVTRVHAQRPQPRGI